MKKIRPDGWEVSFVEFSPADAEAALAAMTEDQRTSSEASVRNLVAEIDAGKFGISNDAFVRTVGGVWLNGKHRCEAIRRTGKTATVLLLTVPDADAKTILRIMDCGCTRTVAHVAQMITHMHNGAIAASVAKMTLAYDRGLMTCLGCFAATNRTAQNRFVSRDTILDYIKAHVAQLEESAAAAKKLNAEYGLFGTTGPAFAHYLIARKYSVKDADAFLNALFTGKGQGSDSVEPLRIAMTKDLKSIRKMPSAAKIASILKAFVAWRNCTVPVRGFVAVGDDIPRV